MEPIPINQEETRIKRIQLSSALGSHLLASKNKCEQMELMIQARRTIDQELITAVAKEFNINVQEYVSWSFEVGDKGVTLALHPRPLPLPELKRPEPELPQAVGE